MRARTFRLWSSLEENFSRTGELPPGGASENPDQELFRSIVQKNDARTCEALVLRGGVDGLLSLRGLIFRGDLTRAIALAAQLADEADSPRELAEIRLEQARLAALRGKWQEAVEVTSEALECAGLAPVSQLTLFQIRSIARFECGEMLAAMQDLDRVDSLASSFPNCPSAFYASVLRARIVARDQGRTQGELLIRALWRRFTSESGTALDRVHALIRAELDVQRQFGLPSPELLLCSYLIAEHTGERLYSGLGALECAFSGHPALEQYFSPLLRTSCREFERVRRLADEIEGRAPLVTVSAANIRRALEEAHVSGRPADLTRTLAVLSEVRQVVLLPHEIVLGLEPYRLESLSPLPQLVATLRCLGGGGVPVRELFNQLWKHVRYSPRIHSTLISSLLHRMKRRTGIRACIQAGQVELQGVLVVREAVPRSPGPVLGC